LEMVGGKRGMAVVEKILGDLPMQAPALTFRQAGVDDVLERRVAKAPALRLARLRIAHEHLRVLELLQLLGGGLTVDHGELVQVERVPEDRSLAREIAEATRQCVEPRADDGLHRRWHRARALPI